MCDNMSESEIVKLFQVVDCHTDYVVSCQFAQHSDLCFATTSKDRSFRIFDWAQGYGFKEREWSPIIGDVKNVYWSPHGAFLVTISGSHRATLWNSQTGDVVQHFTHLKGCTISTCAFSPPPSTLFATAGHDGSVCFWNYVTLCNARYWRADEDAITYCIFTDDGKFFFTSSRSGIKVWEVKMCLSELSATEFQEYRFADYTDIERFDICTRKIYKYKECCPGGSLTGDMQYVEDMEYYVAIGGENNEVQFWSLIATEKTRKVEVKMYYRSRILKRFFGHESTVTCVKFNHSSTMIASVSLDKTLRLWELANLTCRIVVQIHSQLVTDCSFSKYDNFLVTGSYDSQVKIWDMTEILSTQFTPFEEEDEATKNKMKDELEMCIGIKREKINIFQRFSPGENSVNTIHFSKDKILAVGGSDKVISLWKHDGTFFVQTRQSLYYHNMSVQQVEFSRCGKWLATCSHDGHCILWNTTTWESTNSFFLQSDVGFTAIRFSPNSRLLATASVGDSCDVWDLSANQCCVNITGFEDTVTCVAFSEDSEIVACGSASGDVKLYSFGILPANTIRTIRDAHDLGVTSCDFANSRDPFNPVYTLATCGKNDDILLWTINPTWHTGLMQVVLKLTLCGHGGFCTCIRFSPCDSLLASTSGDKTCRLWSTMTGHCLYVLDDHISIVTCCAFSDDCRFLATGSLDRTVIIYELTEHSECQEEARACEASLSTIHSHRNIHWPIFSSVQGLHTDPRILDGHSDISIPDNLLCPINQSLMNDPVKCSDGFTYERLAIQTWFRQHDNTSDIRSPMTNLPLTSFDLVPDIELKSQIHRFKVQNWTNNMDNSITQAIERNVREDNAQAVAGNTDEAAGCSDLNNVFDDIGLGLDQIQLN